MPEGWKNRNVSTEWFYTYESICKAFGALKFKNTIQHNVSLQERAIDAKKDIEQSKSNCLVEEKAQTKSKSLEKFKSSSPMKIIRKPYNLKKTPIDFTIEDLENYSEDEVEYEAKSGLPTLPPKVQPPRSCKTVENQDSDTNSEICDDPEEYSEQEDMADLDDKIYNDPNWSFS